MFSKVGGLFVGLNKIFKIIVAVLCHLKLNSKLIAVITSKQIDHDGDRSEREQETFNKLKVLNDNSFQIRFVCWKMFCQSKQIADKCFKKGENVKEMFEFYKVTMEQINHQLSLQNYVSVYSRMNSNMLEMKDNQRDMNKKINQ